jgi:Flp pilus assembly protein TadG
MARWRSERGQAAVELALVIPVLLLVVLGIVDFGRAVNYWNDENQIAEAAARILAVGGTGPNWANYPTRTFGSTTCSQPSSLATYVTYEACIDSPELANGSQGTTGVQGSGAGVTACYPTNAPGAAVTVTVNANYNWLPLPKVLGGGFQFSQTPLSGSATMRLENQLSGTWFPASSC